MGSWTELIWARQHLLSFDYPVSLCGERRKKKKKRGRRKRRRRRGVRRGVKQCARLYGNAPIADADNGVLTARRLFWRFRRESEKKLKSKRERERERLAKDADDLWTHHPGLVESPLRPHLPRSPSSNPTSLTLTTTSFNDSSTASCNRCRTLSEALIHVHVHFFTSLMRGCNLF